MKVLFTASQRGKQTYGKFYDIIHKEIEKLGFTVMKDDVFSTAAELFYKNLEEDHNKSVELYKQKIHSIQSADICVFETSIHSLSIGFVIQKSLEFNKPTIVLYYKNQTPYFLTGIENEKLIIHNYDETNIAQIVKKALLDAQDLREKDLIFYFPFFVNLS